MEQGNGAINSKSIQRDTLLINLKARFHGLAERSNATALMTESNIGSILGSTDLPKVNTSKGGDPSVTANTFLSEMEDVFLIIQVSLERIENEIARL